MLGCLVLRVCVTKLTVPYLRSRTHLRLSGTTESREYSLRYDYDPDRKTYTFATPPRRSNKLKDARLIPLPAVDGVKRGGYARLVNYTKEELKMLYLTCNTHPDSAECAARELLTLKTRPLLEVLGPDCAPTHDRLNTDDHFTFFTYEMMHFGISISQVRDEYACNAGDNCKNWKTNPIPADPYWFWDYADGYPYKIPANQIIQLPSNFEPCNHAIPNRFKPYQCQYSTQAWGQGWFYYCAKGNEITTVTPPAALIPHLGGFLGHPNAGLCSHTQEDNNDQLQYNRYTNGPVTCNPENDCTRVLSGPVQIHTLRFKFWSSTPHKILEEETWNFGDGTNAASLTLEKFTQSTTSTMMKKCSVDATRLKNGIQRPYLTQAEADADSQIFDNHTTATRMGYNIAKHIFEGGGFDPTNMSMYSFDMDFDEATETLYIAIYYNSGYTYFISSTLKETFAENQTINEWSVQNGDIRSNTQHTTILQFSTPVEVGSCIGSYSITAHDDILILNKAGPGGLHYTRADDFKCTESVHFDHTEPRIRDLNHDWEVDLGYAPDAIAEAALVDIPNINDGFAAMENYEAPEPFFTNTHPGETCSQACFNFAHDGIATEARDGTGNCVSHAVERNATHAFTGGSLHDSMVTLVIPSITGVLPTERAYHSAVVSGEYMVVFGGSHGATHLNDVHTLHLTTGVWTSPTIVNAPPPPPVRSGHSAVSWVDASGTPMMTIFGGVFGAYSFLNDIYTLNLHTWTWNEVSTSGTPPSARSDHSAVSWVDVSGTPMMTIFGGEIHDQSGTHHKNETKTLNLTSGEWGSTVVGPIARAGHSAVVWGESMIIFGGENDTHSSNDVYVINLIDGTWTIQNDEQRPSKRRGHSAVVVGDSMIVFGGYDGGPIKNDVHTLNLATSVWTTQNACPNGLESHSAVAWREYMIVFGGRSGGNIKTNEVHIFWSYMWPNPHPVEFKHWKNESRPRPIATSIAPVWGHSAIASGDYMVVYGGFNGSYKNDVHTLDLTTGVWSVQSSAPSARYGHSAVGWINASGTPKMTVFGGNDGSRKNDVLTLDIVTGAWTTIQNGNAPSARSAHSAVIWGGSMVIFGGNDGTFKNDVHTLDLATGAWSGVVNTSGTPPSARRYHSAVVYGDLMIVFGGDDGGYKNDTHTLDLSTWVWTSPIINALPSPVINALPSIRSGHSAVVWGDSMLVFGGTNGVYFNDVNTLDLINVTWTTIPNGNAPSARNYHSAVVWGGSMVVFGGSNGTTLSDTHSLNIQNGMWTEVNPPLSYVVRNGLVHSSFDVITADTSVVPTELWTTATTSIAEFVTYPSDAPGDVVALAVLRSNGDHQIECVAHLNEGIECTTHYMNVNPAWNRTDTWTEHSNIKSIQLNHHYLYVLEPNAVHVIDTITHHSTTKALTVDGFYVDDMFLYAWNATTYTRYDHDWKHETIFSRPTGLVTFTDDYVYVWNTIDIQRKFLGYYLTPNGNNTELTLGWDVPSVDSALCVCQRPKSATTLEWTQGIGGGTAPATITWSARNAHAAVCFDDGVVMTTGGWPNDGDDVHRTTTSSNGVGGTALTEVSPTPTTFTARSGHAIARYGETVLIVGGFGASTYRNDALLTEDRGATFVTKSNMVFTTPPHVYTSLVALGPETFVAFGGESSWGSFFNDVRQTTDTGVTWTTLRTDGGGGGTNCSNVAMWSRRGDMAYTYMPLRNRIVLAGGYGVGYYQDVWGSDDGGTCWEQLTADSDGAATSGYARASLVVATLCGGEMLILAGGTNGSSDLNSVYRSLDGGANWDYIASAPPTGSTWPGRSRSALVYDLANRRIVSMGGTIGVTTTGSIITANDLWTAEVTSLYTLGSCDCPVEFRWRNKTEGEMPRLHSVRFNDNDTEHPIYADCTGTCAAYGEECVSNRDVTDLDLDVYDDIYQLKAATFDTDVRKGTFGYEQASSSLYGFENGAQCGINRHDKFNDGLNHRFCCCGRGDTIYNCAGEPEKGNRTLFEDFPETKCSGSRSIHLTRITPTPKCQNYYIKTKGNASERALCRAEAMCTAMVNCGGFNVIGNITDNNFTYYGGVTDQTLTDATSTCHCDISRGGACARSVIHPPTPPPTPYATIPALDPAEVSALRGAYKIVPTPPPTRDTTPHAPTNALTSSPTSAPTPHPTLPKIKELEFELIMIAMTIAFFGLLCICCVYRRQVVCIICRGLCPLCLRGICCVFPGNICCCCCPHLIPRYCRLR